MLVCVEGPIGVGKFTLLSLCRQYLVCHTLFEEAERNPFLSAYYQTLDRDVLCRHVQYTFLFLQEQAWREGVQKTGEDELLLSDFHPMKSLIFARMLFGPEEQAHLLGLYQRLRICPPDLVIYLKADVHTILSRVRRRHDAYVDELDFSYLTRLDYAYETFFRTYEGVVLTIDTTLLDYVERPTDVRVPLQKLQECFKLFSYVKPTKALLTRAGAQLIHHTDETRSTERDSL